MCYPKGMSCFLSDRSALALTALLLGSACSAPSRATAQAEAAPASGANAAAFFGEQPPVFKQAAIGSMACGPCSLYNSLVAGGAEHRAVARALSGATAEEKIHSLITRFGSAASVVYPNHRTRYEEDLGTTTADLVAIANDLLFSEGAQAVEGRWLKRLEGESQDEQLRRIHRAFSSATLPPIIEVRSFVADVKERGDPLWEGLFGHFLVVRSVDPLPDDGQASGFLMHCADSSSGRIIPVFASIERYRPFTATDGFTVDQKGKEHWHWAPNSPFMLLTAPDLSLRTQRGAWYERTIMAMTWGLFEATRPAAKAARTGALRSSR